jgi:hypothetical protein
MVEEHHDEPETEEQIADDLEEELLDAMRVLRRKNKSVEEYLDGLARETDKSGGKEKSPGQD